MHFVISLVPRLLFTGGREKCGSGNETTLSCSLTSEHHSHTGIYVHDWRCDLCMENIRSS